MSDRAATAQNRNRVSISPNESPANTPEGLCSERITGKLEDRVIKTEEISFEVDSELHGR